MSRINPSIPFKILSENFQDRNYLCETGGLGKSYSLRHDKITRFSCNQWSCKPCRKAKKRDLHHGIIQAVNQQDLNNQIILTFPGIETRKKFNYEQSYPIMSHEWHKLLNLLKRKQPGLSYIVLPRSQNNPFPGNPAGYCHYHIFTNKPFTKTWITNQIKRNNYILGKPFCNKNKDLSDYLMTDFYIEEEWAIPENVRHYNCSQDLKLNPGQGYEKDPDNIYFGAKASLSLMETAIYSKYKRLLPFVEYIKLFATNNHT